MSLFEQRLKRTMDAVAMKPVDKIPFSYSGPAYVAHRQKVKIADFLSDYAKAVDASVDFCKTHPGIDSMHSHMMPASMLTLLWLAKVKLPGVELPDDELWQLDEKENISFDDYEKILQMGYGAWLEDYLVNRMGNPMAKMGAFFEYFPESIRRMTMEAGVPIMNYASTGTAFEGLCGGRQLMNFFEDLVDEPELMKKVLDNAHEYTYKSFCAQLDAMKPPAVWVGGWRVAPALLSHDTWMEFVWPYLKPLIMACVERNVLPVLHFDSCWERELETLKELPEKKCLLMLDGTTDMRKARAVLDNRMCLMGDVPSRMMAFSKPEEVYEYVTKLIDDVGPKTGLIVSTGCDCPLNAKDENVDAIIQATVDYHIG